MATTNWPFERMQHLLDWHLLLAAPVGRGGSVVEGDSRGRSSGDKPPCPLSLRQQRKWVMFVWKPRAAIPLVLMCGPPGMRVSISTRIQGERKRNRTHTDLVPRTNNQSDKPPGIPRKSPNRWDIQMHRKNKTHLGGNKGPEKKCTAWFLKVLENKSLNVYVL